MAVTVRDWALGTAVACALIAVAKLPPSPEAPLRRRQLGDFRTPRTRDQRIEAALAEARRALRLAERRAALLRTVRARFGGGRQPGQALFISELRLPDTTRRVIETTLASVSREIGPPAQEIVVGVVGVEYGYTVHFLPPATDGRTCIVQLPLGWELRWIVRTPEPPAPEQLEPWLRSGLGPCAFYAAFGRPGPAVERWLLDRSFDLGSDMDWVGPRAPGRWYAPDDTIPTMRALRAMLFWEGDPRYTASLDAVACSVGDLARCRVALFASDTTRPPWGQRRDPPGVVRQLWWWELPSSLYGGSGYLADLVRDQGRDRFQAFWRSALPVDSAFQLTMGMPIEVWTARWQGERMGVMRVGSRIRPRSVFLGLLVAGLFVAGGALLAARRRVA